MQQKFGCIRSGAHLTPTKNWGEHKAVHLTPKTRVDTQRRTLCLTIAVLNKMRYTPLATDGLCPMPARAPHVTEKGYNCPNIHLIVAGSSFSFSPSANPSLSCFNSDTIAPLSRQASVFSGLMAIARS